MFVCVSLACRRTEGEGLLATFAAAAVVVVGWWWPGAGGVGGDIFLFSIAKLCMPRLLFLPSTPNSP